MIKYILIFACLFTIQGFAIMPPLYQTAEEIKAIMEDKELGQKLQSGEPIMLIEKNKEGYKIMTNQHQLQINVLYEKPKHPGPRHFTLSFSDAVPLFEAP